MGREFRAAGSAGGNGRRRRSADGVAAKVDEQTERVLAKVDEQTERVLAKVDAKTERALAKVDAKTTRAATKVDAKTAQAVAKVDEKTTRMANKVSEKAAKLAQHAARGAAALDRVAAHLDAVDLWTRTEPGARRPRFGRAEIAAAAIRVADAEGLDALSMRRLATDLDVGTMTLYHYVRTKDELLALVVDALLGEVVVPADEALPDEWRAAITVIARRSRDSLRRHPWVFDVGSEPSIGPNAMRHFDQSWQAVGGLDADFETTLDVITAVDEYVFGFCLHEHRTYADGGDDSAMLRYMDELLAAGTYPSLQALTNELGLPAVWERMHAHATDDARFERNLERLLAGFAMPLRPGSAIY